MAHLLACGEILVVLVGIVTRISPHLHLAPEDIVSPVNERVIFRDLYCSTRVHLESGNFLNVFSFRHIAVKKAFIVFRSDFPVKASANSLTRIGRPCFLRIRAAASALVSG
jgi:hypothetical protein